MNIVLIGSGGREHAFAYKIVASKHCSRLFCLPGNGGTSSIAQNVAIDLSNFEAIRSFVIENKIEMVVVGPEAPLAAGLADFFCTTQNLQDIIFIGPQQAGAQLESSKAFAKAFMQKYHIPTAQYRAFTIHSKDDAFEYAQTLGFPVVVKADGLAAGKGVKICNNESETFDAINSFLVQNSLGDAGKTVVIEQFLQGIEASVFILTDGKDYVLLPSAKDYKRIGEKDMGENTGGMGAVSPPPFVNDVFLQNVAQKIIVPTLNGLEQENIPFVGFIFLGLMHTLHGTYLLEYNVRMGDPETQAVLPRIKSDFVELLLAAGKRELKNYVIDIDNRTAVTVICASEGYPASYKTGFEILGISDVSNAIVFQAGTKIDKQMVISNGGRVLAVTAIGESLPTAMQTCYQELSKIHFKNIYFRKDIGKDLI